MFFRRRKSRPPTFEERLQAARDAGFAVEAGPDSVRASRGQCAAVIRDIPGKGPDIGHAGILIGNEIAYLVDAGYQKFFETPSQKRLPAQASHLKAIHAFDEDLREALGIKSLYNESLGTRNDLHMYDRVEGRDHPRPRPWDR